MRRCAPGASSTKPRCASRLLASMISSRKSGQRAWFERLRERGEAHVAYWQIVLQSTEMRTAEALQRCLAEDPK